MITKEHYIDRRNKLKQALGSGVIIMLGNRDVPFNYPANPYDFRQDSNFLYFFGINRPGFAAVIDIDNNQETLFGDDVDIAAIVWIGEQKSVRESADEVGVAITSPYSRLGDVIADCLKTKQEIHFLPLYRTAGLLEMGNLLNLNYAEVNQHASVSCVQAVVELRSSKDTAEIDELMDAVDIARDMHLAMMKMAMPGITEREISGRLRGIALSRGSALSFPPIITVDGEILHNLENKNTLTKDRLLLTDAGAENNAHYVSDISRTVPVGGVFSDRQRDIYEIVLEANSQSITAIRPGVPFREIHLNCARTITAGLKELGIMKGSVDDAVAEGAHALFFPHGLGHMLGLDAHDMEGLGEDKVGYDESVQRSSQFGLSNLRLARKLEAGFVVTVEPGIYFIPLLIEKWKKESKCSPFIDFGKVEAFLDFGGIRIEDNIVVTVDGQVNLSSRIPKSIAEIEAAMSQD